MTPAMMEVRMNVPAEFVADMARTAPGSADREAFMATLGRIAFDALVASLINNDRA